MNRYKEEKGLFSRTKIFCSTSLRVGFFLASKQLLRTSKWTTGLIIFVMMLTFMNLVFVSGILSGLVEGSSIAYRKQYSGDLILSNYESKDFITDSVKTVNILKSFPEVLAVSPRILYGTTLEANYRDKEKFTDKSESLGVKISGIDPIAEDSVTGLESLLIAGKYLEREDQNEVLIGSNLLNTYSRDVPGDETLSNVDVGSKVRILVNGEMVELVVKGVVKSKIGEVGRRLYLSDKYLRKIIGRPNLNVNEITVLLEEGIDPYQIKESLMKTDVCGCARIETWEESQGQFFKDIAKTFDFLGLLIGGIGIVVASITVFIVIFINAVTRRKYIGILKGIGVCGTSIEISYILQSVFYGLFGSLFGSALLYGFIKPYVDRNPIDFPFSDGILVAPVEATIIKIGVLMIVTILAGYIPSRMIVGKNTLDSILGR